MLSFDDQTDTPPARTVVLGAAGFVGRALVTTLETAGVETVGLARSDVDLLAKGADEALAARLRPGDAVVVVSARAPVKNADMLRENLDMLSPVVEALKRVSPSHLVYVSSDAVYRDSAEPLTEASCAEPGSLHGVMHLARELVLRTEVAEPAGIPFAVLRPTLIYGAADPHNGYGPNRFRRLAAAGEPIVLFGEGEERRDHVAVEDVAELASRLVRRRADGVLNAATGRVASFREIAELVVSYFDQPVEPPVEIRGSPRVGPMPHGGYRPFDPTATRDAFPDFKYTALEDGLARAHRDALAS
jgi:UDP-glucose 4-epimerase